MDGKYLWNNSEVEFYLLQQGVVTVGEEKIHIRPVRSKDVALLEDLGFSSPHILFKSAAREAEPARGNSHGEGAVSWWWHCFHELRGKICIYKYTSRLANISHLAEVCPVCLVVILIAQVCC